MIKVVTSAERHTAKKGPVHSEYSFSFADYDDPGNAHFGCLLVLNDHRMSPGHSLEPHSHQELEIVTCVLSGQLLHTLEPAGSKELLEEGSFQVLSAGTGVTHSEHAPVGGKPVRYLQMWFLPEERGLEPKVSHRCFPKEQRVGRMEPIISSDAGTGEKLQIRQDVMIYAPVLTDRKPVQLSPDGRRIHLFVIAGHADFSCGKQTFSLHPGDAARVQSKETISISKTGEDPAELLIIEMP
ncbi:quercetin 2,3-dioxygenase [Paenibacillus antibioticophila]|uniref:Quercetin 2,3-dioxygenase n=1 Tax=Paenibacillus antibioticophila TaxID=1274374 RepID=A0A919XWC9_9BACL|nr:pirin family protein [Paenibacillus antibioticophila]GIO37580.1 quercetin 2,3-dioxygenase [Paenibacillus antibioticophila]